MVALGSPTWILIVSGELDLMTGPALESRLDRLMATAIPAGLVLDLQGVTFMDAGGLRTIVRSANRYGDCIALQRPSPPVSRVLRIVGLDDSLPILTQPWSSTPPYAGVILRHPLGAETF